MTDLDKMARGLLAAEYEADRDYRSAAAIRGRCKLGAPWAAERPAVDAIRTALLTAPPGYVLVPVEPTPEMRDAGEASASVWQDAWECGNVYRAMLAAAPEVK